MLADPAGSILKDVVEKRTPPPAGSWLVEGIGEDFVPEIADLSRVTHAYAITDAESFAAARELLQGRGPARRLLDRNARSPPRSNSPARKPSRSASS